MNKRDIISGGTVALYHGHTLGTLFFTPAGFVPVSYTHLTLPTKLSV